MARIRALLLVLAVMAVAGCAARTLQASATQPNPLRYPTDTLRESERLFINVGVRDMDVPQKMVMTNSAYFVVTSRDRLRFHITLEHQWEEMANASGWSVWLEDDQGHRFQPEAKEDRRTVHRSRMWDYEQRSGIYNAVGDIVGVKNDGYAHPVFLGSVDRFRGEGDYVFHAHDIFRPDVRRLALVMERDGLRYRYVWNFSDGPAEVDHYDQTPSFGGYIYPGPLTQGR